MKAKSRHGIESYVDFIAGNAYEVVRDTDGCFLVTDEVGCQRLFSEISFYKLFDIIEIKV